MLFGNRRPRKLDSQRKDGAYRPQGERMEAKLLLAIDLGGTSPPANPVIATTPFGMGFGGSIASGGAGWSVADVGDVNGDQYDDFVVGAPTVSTTGALGSGVNGTAYLIFGSRSVTSSSITDWIGRNSTNTGYLYTANDRVGDLGQLGATTQTNPISGTALDFPFSGLKFVTAGSNIASQLGVSVAGVRLPSGARGILIGAPNGNDANDQNLGTGRAYLISGSFNNFVGQTINLDTPTTFAGLNIVTFVNSTSPGAQLGRSVAGGQNILGDGLGNIILGAPAATVDGQTNSGAVYMLSTGVLSGATQTIDVSTLGQSGTQSVIFAGASSGDQAGFSVADALDVNGATAGGVNVNSLLIGAPQNGSSGAAYLIYGGSSLANLATTTSGVRFINLANVGAASGTTGAVPGARITAPSTASRTGFAVSSAGDFNLDGFADILIGSPGFNSGSSVNQGEASLLYGAAINTAGYLTGTISLASLPTGIQGASFTGINAGDLAGYAVTPIGFINSGQPNPILIGSPGFNANAGTAYLIPGRSGFLSGSFSLGTTESAPLSGIQFLLSTPSSATTSPPFFGASVSSRFQDTSFTADSDSREDFIIGAPGYDVTQDTTRALAGGAQIIQGGLITVPIPASLSITTQIGVGTAFPPSGSTSFPVNATTPTNLDIFVFSTTTTSPAFNPVRDINPATVVVNNIAFSNATIRQDPVDENGDGIPDAIITITPRSNLGLNPSVTSLTISGQTLATSPLSNQTWTGTAPITVSGSVTPPGPTVLGAVPPGPVLETTFTSQFGANQFVPSISQLSAYNYAPIPLSVALQQYLPGPGFNDRIYTANHPGKQLRLASSARGIAATGLYKAKRPYVAVPAHVFHRSRFHAGQSYAWTHRSKIGVFRGVVPVQLTQQHVGKTPGVTGQN